MRTLSFEETNTAAGGFFTEIGTFVGVCMWIKVTTTHVTTTIFNTGALPILTPSTAVGGLFIYVGCSTIIGAIVDQTATTIANCAYSIFSFT